MVGMRFFSVVVIMAAGCGGAQVAAKAPQPAPPYANAAFTSCVVVDDSEPTQYLVQRDVRIGTPTIETCPGYVVVPQRLFYPGTEVQEVERLASYTATDCFYKAPERFGDIDCKLAPQQSPPVAPNN